MNSSVTSLSFTAGNRLSIFRSPRPTQGAKIFSKKKFFFHLKIALSKKKNGKDKGKNGRKGKNGKFEHPPRDSVVALIMGKNGEKMDFGYGKTFLEKVSWGGPETPFCGISGPIPACGGVYTEKWTKF